MFQGSPEDQLVTMGESVKEYLYPALGVAVAVAGIGCLGLLAPRFEDL